MCQSLKSGDGGQGEREIPLGVAARISIFRKNTGINRDEDAGKDRRPEASSARQINHGTCCSGSSPLIYWCFPKFTHRPQTSRVNPLPLLPLPAPVFAAPLPEKLRGYPKKEWKELAETASGRAVTSPISTIHCIIRTCANGKFLTWDVTI